MGVVASTGTQTLNTTVELTGLTRVPGHNPAVEIVEVDPQLVFAQSVAV